MKRLRLISWLKTYSIILCLCSITINVKSQLPGPATLGVGLNTVTGSKGTIDTELLGELIFEKQIEIRRELIKRGISKLLLKENYALWEFGYITTHALLDGNNKDIITKKILEQAANLNMLYKFAEYGLTLGEVEEAIFSIAKKSEIGITKINEGQREFSELPESIKNIYLDIIYDVLISEDEVTSNLGFFSNRLPLGKDFYSKVSQSQIRVISDQLIAPSKSSISNQMQQASTDSKKDKKTKFLDDSIAVSNNIFLIKKVLKDHLKFYLENYYLLNEVVSASGEFGLLFEYGKVIGDDLENTVKDLKSKLNNLLGEYDSIKQQNESQTYSKSNLRYNRGYQLEKNGELNGLGKKIKDVKSELIDYENRISKKAESYLIDSLDNYINDFKKDLRGVLSNEKLLGQVNKTNTVIINALPQNLSGFEKEITHALIEIESFVDRIKIDKNEVYTRDLYYIKEKATPLVGKLIVNHNLDPKYLTVIRKVEASLTSVLLAQKSSDSTMLKTTTEFIKSQKVKGVNIQTLLELDKASSYEEIIDDLRYILVDNSSNEGVKTLLSLLNNIDLNMISNVANSTLELDVEDIILWMYDTYIDKVSTKSGQFSPYFVIGLNYSNFRSIGHGSISKDAVNQFSYASEKIGMSYNVIDFKRRYTQEKHRYTQVLDRTVVRSYEPVVSNVHVTGFASGIMYTLLDATTQEEFDSPLLGIGAGFSFFNSLELNVSHVWPLDMSRSSPTLNRFFQFSFDIKLFDYIASARKKRLALKTSKIN